MGRKGTLFLYNIGSDVKHSLFLLVFFCKYKCTSYKRVVNGCYTPFYHIQIYCGAPVDTNDNSNKNTSEDTSSHKRFCFFLTSSLSHLIKKKNSLQIRGRKLLFMLEMFAKDLTKHFRGSSVKTQPVTISFA